MNVRDELVSFNRSLAVGMEITACWTWSYGQYKARAVVVKVNEKSLRVKLLDAVRYGRDGGLPAGHVIVLPRFGSKTYSERNCACAAQ